MKLLQDKIKQAGKVLPGNVLQVNSFLNHQVDPQLMKAVAEEFRVRFADVSEQVTKVVTAETSGIAPAVLTGLVLNVPVVFARKKAGANMDDSVYRAQAFSYTKHTNNSLCIQKEFLTAKDRVLIVDDFLANGQAVLALKDLCDQAGAQVLGAGIVIEKAFQEGESKLAAAGVRVEALAKITKLAPNVIEFAD